MGDQIQAAAPSYSRYIRFPIGVKLMLIISALLALSLGAITVMVSMLVRTDVRITAEDNNFTLNRRVAAGVETSLGAILSNTRTLLTANPRPGEAESAYFFEHNRDIAAIYVFEEHELVNRAFFRERQLPADIRHYTEGLTEAMHRGALGETLVLNGYPAFDIPLLALIFPWHTGTEEGQITKAVLILFSAEKINEYFTFGSGSQTVSFLINGDGEALIHPDPEVLKSGTRLGKTGLVKTALESGNRSFQTVYTDTDGREYFGAYQKLSPTDALLITRIPAETVLKGINDVTVRNIMISAAVLILSLLIIALFSKTISGPLKALAKAASAIEAGNYTLSLKCRSRDELGLLTKGFIGMAHALENFEKFTNKRIVNLARQGKLKRSGENKMVAISFIVIRDFDEIAGDMDAKDIVAFVNSFLSRIVPCISATGGVVDKFLTQDGAVVMALWGAVESTGDTRENTLACVRSALMIRAVLSNWNAIRTAGDKDMGKHYPLIKIGCGINIGEVIAGQMGSERRMEYTVIGDAVNLAARIEGPNDVFDTDILVTENIIQTAGDYLLTQEMPSIEVKGKKNALRVFSVLNIHEKGTAEELLRDLDNLPRTNPVINRRCAGPAGPGNMEEVRASWRNPAKKNSGPAVAEQGA